MHLHELHPFPARDVIRVVVETPQGSRNKYNYDPDLGAFVLRKMLPAGLHFPCAFGFIPRTQGADGDPLDVFIFFEEPLPVGCVVECRLAGVLIATQREGRRWMRNDRFLVIATDSIVFHQVREPKDFPATIITQLKDFLMDYTRREGKHLKPLRVANAEAARALIDKQLKPSAPAS